MSSVPNAPLTMTSLHRIFRKWWMQRVAESTRITLEISLSDGWTEIWDMNFQPTQYMEGTVRTQIKGNNMKYDFHDLHKLTSLLTLTIKMNVKRAYTPWRLHVHSNRCKCFRTGGNLVVNCYASDINRDDANRGTYLATAMQQTFCLQDVAKD